MKYINNNINIYFPNSYINDGKNKIDLHGLTDRNNIHKYLLEKLGIVISNRIINYYHINKIYKKPLYMFNISKTDTKKIYFVIDSVEYNNLYYYYENIF